MGVLYIIGGLPFFYSISSILLTLLSIFIVPKKSTIKKVIYYSRFIVSLLFAIVVLYITNGNTIINTIIGILGILGIPGAIILQFWLFIILKADTII
jgi:hypothetical protein